MTNTIQARLAWASLFLLAALLWGLHIDRPVDLPSWHEFDYSSIARNFVQEGNNILYPRIDWRRDGPGFAEMEFPAHPWLMAQLDRLFGMHEIWGRLISYFASLISLGVFCRLALYLLPPPAAWAAALFFVISRVTLYVASAIQPEALMLMFYLLAAYFFLRWYERGGRATYFAAVACYAGAMLIKSPAAHLGLLFFFFALKKDGRQALLRPALWVFAVASVLPITLWSVHAYSLWTTYHNSLGVSNEDHWIGLDMLRHPKAWFGLVATELFFVFGLGGSVLAGFGVVNNRQSRAVEFALLWGAAIAIYYVVILRTAGAYWAWYYHIVAVPPAALLFGSGIEWLRTTGLRVRTVVLGGAVAALPLVLALHFVARHESRQLQIVRQDLLAAHLDWATLLALSAVSLLMLVLLSKLFGQKGHDRLPAALSTPVSLTVGAALVIWMMTSGQFAFSMWTQFATRTPDFACTSCFADKIATHALIVASGGNCIDPSGHKIAGDAPQMFYWLDRKGFSLCEDSQSIEELQTLAHRGAQYFIADKASVQSQPTFEAALKRAFPLLGECSKAWLFQLPSGYP
jgi:4-amino-4-deoxy-L-arabinose transferase-like glycosyltransferase